MGIGLLSIGRLMFHCRLAMAGIYGSKLYQKQGDGTLAISNESRWRSNWFVAVDIPLANFGQGVIRRKISVLCKKFNSGARTNTCNI
jgi:hypothetical protein